MRRNAPSRFREGAHCRLGISLAGNFDRSAPIAVIQLPIRARLQNPFMAKVTSSQGRFRCRGIPRFDQRSGRLAFLSDHRGRGSR